MKKLPQTKQEFDLQFGNMIQELIKSIDYASNTQVDFHIRNIESFLNNVYCSRPSFLDNCIPRVFLKTYLKNKNV